MDRAWLSTPMCVCDCKLEAGSVFLLFAVTYVHYVPTYVHVNVYTHTVSYIHVYVRTCKCLYTHGKLYTCIHTCTYMCSTNTRWHTYLIRLTYVLFFFELVPTCTYQPQVML